MMDSHPAGVRGESFALGIDHSQAVRMPAGDFRFHVIERGRPVRVQVNRIYQLTLFYAGIS